MVLWLQEPKPLHANGNWHRLRSSRTRGGRVSPAALLAAKQLSCEGEGDDYSHSIVPGGFDV